MNNSGYIRKELCSIEEVLLETVPTYIDRRESRVDFNGDLIKMNSDRYNLFKEKGIQCVNCGLNGIYFAKEKHKKDKSYHFNLYGVNEDGREIMITKDHIVPKSKGGENTLENYQTMCFDCNAKKADKIVIKQ